MATDPDIDAEIDALYRLEPGAFIAARGALAKSLKASDQARSAEVAKLAKPTVSAWAVNQLYWQERAAFEAMLEAGEQARVLQTRAMRGEAVSGLAEALDARQRALRSLARLAERRLEEVGAGTGLAVLRRVETTLEALAAYGRAREAPRVGRLSADLDPPGFGILASLGVEPREAPELPRADASPWLSPAPPQQPVPDEVEAPATQPDPEAERRRARVLWQRACAEAAEVAAAAELEARGARRALTASMERTRELTKARALAAQQLAEAQARLNEAAGALDRASAEEASVRALCEAAERRAAEAEGNVERLRQAEPQ